MKIKRGIIQMLVAAVITLFAAGCSDMVEELKVQGELKFLTPGSYTISGTDYTIMKTLVTKNGESAGTVDSNGLVTINVDSSTTYEITVLKDGTLTLVKNDSSSVVTYVGKFTFKTKTETTLKNTADASDTIVFVMNAEIGALPDGTYEIDGTNYTISDKTVTKESDGSSAGSVGSDGIVTVNKSESEGLTITVFGDYSVEALKTTTADGETTKKFYKGAFESSIATLKKDGTDDSDTLVIKKIASAGNISYATTSVSKTTDDEPFTNELTKTGDGTVSYASSKTDVAEVNTQTGLVTIKGAGETTITATVADSESYTYAVKTASYTLTVTAADTTQQKSAGSISYATTTVSKTTADVAFTNELTKTGDGTVTYTSDNTAVATVNEDGEVTIKGAGTATITATVADSDTYTYATKTASYTLTVTQATPPTTSIGTKAPTEAKAVGDIVFNDGSATPYTADLTLTEEQKAAAIALIFYVGTGLNSGDDTTTSRTLGVGLKHTSGLAWCTTGANAYSKNITTIQCPASGYGGAWTFTGDRNGSDNLEQIATFLGEGNDTATEGRYPAFYFAKNYSKAATNLGDSYKDGWYLPSIAELFQIYANGKGRNKVFDIDAASTLCGGDTFGAGVPRVWSSSQHDNSSMHNFAYELYVSNGTCGGDAKSVDLDDLISACAVRAF